MIDEMNIRPITCLVLSVVRLKSSSGTEFCARYKRDQHQSVCHVVTVDTVTWPTHRLPGHLLERKFVSDGRHLKNYTCE